MGANERELEERLYHLNRQPCPNCGYAQRVAANKIIRDIAVFHDVPLSVMLGLSRTKPAVHARDCAVQRLRDEMGLTLEQIACIFHRHHTTIVHSINKAS